MYLFMPKFTYYLIFRCITRHCLLLGRPGVGYITNAGYTLFKFEIAKGHFFIIMVKCLLISRLIWFFFYFTALGHVGTSGGWPLHTCLTLTMSRHSVIQTLHQWRCDILLPRAAVNLWIIHCNFRRFLIAYVSTTIYKMVFVFKYIGSPALETSRQNINIGHRY